MTSSSEGGKQKRGRLARRFNLALALVYLLTVAVTVPGVYWYTSEQMREQVNKEISLLVDVTNSIQSYVIKDLRPYMVEQEIGELSRAFEQIRRSLVVATRGTA